MSRENILKSSIRRNYPTILFDEAHQQAWSMESILNKVNPDDSCMKMARSEIEKAGFKLVVNTTSLFSNELLSKYDALFLTHSSDPKYEKTTGNGESTLSSDEINAIREYVFNGGGLLLAVEHENDKYNNSRAELLEAFGIELLNNTVVDPENSFNNVASWVKPKLFNAGEGVLTRVNNLVFYRAASVRLKDDSEAKIIAKSSSVADPKEEAMVILKEYGAGKVAVVTDSDLFGDDSFEDGDHKVFLINLLSWIVAKRELVSEKREVELGDNWFKLKSLVNRFRDYQDKDGSVLEEYKEEARVDLDLIIELYNQFTNLHPHNKEFYNKSIADLRRWSDENFGKPDFLDSLQSFRPDLHRVNGLEHIVLSVMYTQNGNPDKKLELVWVRTVWPDWIDELESTLYNNKAFIPIEFIDFSEGYNSHSAVLFPETVPVREVPKFYWGAIFCDREAARFVKVVPEASMVLNFTLPSEVEMVIGNKELIKEVYVLWDLVHDRTHSHGELPFDPFMIKQRIPFWMYALEEMRCDLNTFVEMDDLFNKGVAHAKLVKYAIVLDRLLRFPISGGRVKNYDGLVGQIVFGALHKSGALIWSDNKLHIDWESADKVISRLAGEVNSLYGESIDRSRVEFWIAAYSMVNKYVSAHPGSAWLKEREYSKSNKELTDMVLPDEFPLNVFYEALSKKLSKSIEECKGITL